VQWLEKEGAFASWGLLEILQFPLPLLAPCAFEVAKTRAFLLLVMLRFALITKRRCYGGEQGAD